MSSIESMISEIEKEYAEIVGVFESGLVEDIFYRFKDISEDELLALLRQVMSFQRRIESILASTERVTGELGYSKRLNTIAAAIFKKLYINERVDIVKFRYYADPRQGLYTVDQDVYGVITELRSSCSALLHDNALESRRDCYCAYFGFKLLRSDMIEFEEDLRLVSVLSSYPIEKQIELKEKLVLNGFTEVAVSLEEAESNAEEEHFKDCVSRCRDAMEIFVAIVREKETGEKTDKHFATDLAKIIQLGIFDEAMQKLAQGFYSFASLKGSHKYDPNKVTVYDAETALKESYSILEMLFRRYMELLKSKKGA